MILVFILFANTIQSQSNFSLTVPGIYTAVKVRNNYGPPRDISGNAITYGVLIAYSMHPTIITFNKRLVIDLGAGYLNHKFNIERPFHYNSPSQILYYTKDYAYDNLVAIVGLTYLYELRKSYLVNASASCTLLRSFHQQYTPTYNSGSDHFTQESDQHFNFGFTASLSCGLSKKINRYSFGLNAMVPVLSQWRKDPIFEDDPSKYFHPGFSLGANLLFKYWIKPY